MNITFSSAQSFNENIVCFQRLNQPTASEALQLCLDQITQAEFRGPFCIVDIQYFLSASNTFSCVVTVLIAEGKETVSNASQITLFPIASK